METEDIFLYLLFGGVAVLIIGAMLHQSSQIPPVQSTSTVQNEENIKWTDWKGRERVITISRKVH